MSCKRAVTACIWSRTLRVCVMRAERAHRIVHNRQLGSFSCTAAPCQGVGGGYKQAAYLHSDSTLYYINASANVTARPSCSTAARAARAVCALHLLHQALEDRQRPPQRCSSQAHTDVQLQRVTPAGDPVAVAVGAAAAAAVVPVAAAAAAAAVVAAAATGFAAAGCAHSGAAWYGPYAGHVHCPQSSHVVVCHHKQHPAAQELSYNGRTSEHASVQQLVWALCRCHRVCHAQDCRQPRCRRQGADPPTSRCHHACHHRSGRCPYETGLPVPVLLLPLQLQMLHSPCHRPLLLTASGGSERPAGAAGVSACNGAQQ